MIKMKIIQLMRMGIDWGTIGGTVSAAVGFLTSQPVMMFLGVVATAFGLVGGYYNMKKKKYEARITEIDLEEKEEKRKNWIKKPF
jgi:hypothetical protein